MRARAPLSKKLNKKNKIKLNKKIKIKNNS
jgi:hypothetical protein